MGYKIRYTRRDGNPAFLQGATGKVRTFQKKESALKVARIYDHKKSIRVVKGGKK